MYISISNKTKFSYFDENQQKPVQMFKSWLVKTKSPFLTLLLRLIQMEKIAAVFVSIFASSILAF